MNEIPEKPTIEPKKNGPLIVKGLDSVNTAGGRIIKTDAVCALCRCGASKNKPFCDGSHNSCGFTDEKEPARTPDARKDYAGMSITIHDNRALCAHSGFCTDGLKSVFRLDQEPWIDPDGDSVEEIVKAVSACPSGALSYTLKGNEHRDRDSEVFLYAAPNGPYAVKGGIELKGAEWGEGASKEHYNLCRCGKSKNKPFCDGTHWKTHFDEQAPGKPA